MLAPINIINHYQMLICLSHVSNMKQVDIPISNNQVLQIAISYILNTMHIRKSSQIRNPRKFDPHEQPNSTVLTPTQQLTHLITGQPS